MIERAYELAKSGTCTGLTDIRKRLSREGYPSHEIMGKTLIDDLSRHCRIALGKPGDRPPPPIPATPEERAARSFKAAATRRANYG